MTTQTDDTGVRTRNRVSLLLVFALFAAPVVVAWVLFFVFPDWAPESTSNHGALVKPVRPLPEFRLAALGDGEVGSEFLQGKWTFVYLHRGACEKACIEQLYRMRQVRLTQGKNIDRLQRLMLWEAPTVETTRLDELQQHFPGQVTGLLDDNAGPLLAEFALDERDPLTAERLYLVDPLGNLMMMYAPDDEPKGIIRDLERLLKYSGLG